MARRRLRVPRRRWIVLAGIGLIAFLYYKPLRSYMDTRAAVAERKVEVAQLRAETHILQRRLVRSASVQELERQARDLGYVRPGERLYIVKGITAWRRAQRVHRATIAGDG